VNSDAIKSLRKDLGLTQRDLAEALRVDVALVRDWESGEQFATKAHCDAMEKLRESPPPKRPKKATTPMQTLADPAFWALQRKLLAHPALRAACEKLAAEHPDPLDNDGDAPH
jgi:transcriptional regulator with XRE-family HTH domain